MILFLIIGRAPGVNGTSRDGRIQGRIVFIFDTILDVNVTCDMSRSFMYVCDNDFYMLIQIHGQTNRLPPSGIRCSKFALCSTLFHCDTKKCSSTMSVWPIGISKDRIHRIVPSRDMHIDVPMLIIRIFTS